MNSLHGLGKRIERFETMGLRLEELSMHDGSAPPVCSMLWDRPMPSAVKLLKSDPQVINYCTYPAAIKREKTRWFENHNSKSNAGNGTRDQHDVVGDAIKENDTKRSVDTISASVPLAGKRARVEVKAQPLDKKIKTTLLAHPESPRFEPDDPEMLKFLNQHGYAVVGSVADAACIVHAKDLMWSHLQQYGMKPGQPSTWTAFPGYAQSGIIGKDGIGQSDFLWHVRELPRVRRAFAAIWGVEANNLLTSFDGANISALGIALYQLEIKKPAVLGFMSTKALPAQIFVVYRDWCHFSPPTQALVD